MSNAKTLLLSSSPHISSPQDSKVLMRTVLLALAPVAIFGIIMFGIPALLNIIVSMAAAIAGEALFRAVTRQQQRFTDLSAAVSGLLLALVLPPTTPLWMTALGAVFAVVVAKEFFGGLGANVFNPALVGRAFLLMSFPAAITTWLNPSLPLFNPSDAVTGATPLGIIVQGGSLADVGSSLQAFGLGGSNWSMITTLFIGFRGGCTGEISILLILLAGIFLAATRVIDWRTPVSMIAAGFISALVLGMDPVFSVLTGGLVFGAVFMATDYATTPVTPKGKIIFGIGAGIITMLIRKWGTYPEGVSYSILIMNAATPFLNKLLPRKYGFVPKKKPPRANAAAAAGTAGEKGKEAAK